ncbi:unnamed protein product [Clavelina lepadiformis]|uniref:Uncharacterized protein n=1 Tax=Clavelina lepadiformis TaxID=159417 RepID=A0ABP0FRP3_CLALP
MSSPNAQVARIALTRRGFSQSPNDQGRAHSFHLGADFPNSGEHHARSPNVRVARSGPAGARFGATASGHAPSQTPNPAARSRDPEAVLGYHGDAGFCDYYEGAGSRVSECARECESKQNRSRLASGTMADVMLFARSPMLSRGFERSVGSSGKLSACLGASIALESPGSVRN